MKTYLLTAAAVIFLSVIISLIVPEGKMHKSIIFVMRMACILVLIQPITGLFKINAQSGGKVNYDYEYIEKVYSDNQSRELEKLLERQFGEECECFVNVNYGDGEFRIDEVRVSLSSEQKINEIYEYLAELDYINITVYAKSD